MKRTSDRCLFRASRDFERERHKKKKQVVQFTCSLTLIWYNRRWNFVRTIYLVLYVCMHFMYHFYHWALDRWKLFERLNPGLKLEPGETFLFGFGLSCLLFSVPFSISIYIFSSSFWVFKIFILVVEICGSSWIIWNLIWICEW